MRQPTRTCALGSSEEIYRSRPACLLDNCRFVTGALTIKSSDEQSDGAK
jgi:hypothetical protein